LDPEPFPDFVGFFVCCIFINMKIIITEDQYKKFISLQRRITDIIDEVIEMVDLDSNFWGSTDFCYYFPTLKKFVDDLVYEIIQQYRHPIDDIDETENFIYNHIGYENFVNILMDTHGEKIKNFYNEKTKDC